MTLDVEPEQVRDAARELERAAEPVGCLFLSATNATAEKFGHVELAGWAASLLEYGARIGTELSTAATTMATGLRTTADDLEAQDERAKSLLTPFDWLPALDPTPAPGPSPAPPTGGGGGSSVQ